MSDRLYPMHPQRLAAWIRDELRMRGSVFGVDRGLFFHPREGDPYRTEVFNQLLDFPVGVAAGPHTQMAQNIVTAWLCGARFIELKTVQILDRIEVSKPCIDMEDAGFNVEWSQELRIHESVCEYIKAWVLIHALHHELRFPGAVTGTVFNISVGYDMAGIRKPNVQAFLDTMRNASNEIAACVEEMKSSFPALEDIPIPAMLSDNITLSTMHGCPPGEIGTISRYLLEERGLHTYVKMNPTLLGPDVLRPLLNETLGYRDIEVPDEAFGHDIAYDDAVALIRDLETAAAGNGLEFGVKLSNTLEVKNHRKVFSGDEKQMYMSGRPLHALTVEAARRLQETFDGRLSISFAGGADAFNVPDLLAAGMKTVTVCSDLLRTGGYTRLAQYRDVLRSAMNKAGAENLDMFILARAENGPDGDVAAAARKNLEAYAASLPSHPAYHADTYDRSQTKSARELGLFDCIAAPCTEACSVDQKVPRYMRFVREQRFDDAAKVVKSDNTMPCILGRACHHPCQPKCVRVHMDEPLAIREIKRAIMEYGSYTRSGSGVKRRKQHIAVIGAGPCGLAAADFLTRDGFQVTVFDAAPSEGGMVQSSIPGYRASDDALHRDVAFLQERGVTLAFGQSAGRDFTLSSLMKRGFSDIVVAVGAQKAGRLGLPGEEADGVLDSLAFLREARSGARTSVGQRVGVIGGGDVAMDCARTAWRLGAKDVSVIYRRTLREMPAQPEEFEELAEERIPVRELLSPISIRTEGGRLHGLECQKMRLGEPGADGRRRPEPIDGETEMLDLDNLVVAINQAGEYRWLEDEGIRLNRRGYIETMPDTLETSVPHVYAGGDAIGDGPATIVKALGDGRKIAAAITDRYIRHKPVDIVPDERPDWRTLQRRRAFRVHPVPVPRREPGERRDFGEVVQTLSPRDAETEARRCLDCDLICSYCVGVCPNLALFTYRHRPLELLSPAKKTDKDTAGKPLAEQAHQVAVLTDFCNECGNCVTFCPSAGRPYRDKPRLYFRRPDFDGESDNAFLPCRLPDGMGMLARWHGKLHRLEMAAGEYRYAGPGLTAVWKENGSIKEHDAPDGDEAAADGFSKANIMAALLRGLKNGMPFVPYPHGGEAGWEG